MSGKLIMKRKLDKAQDEDIKTLKIDNVKVLPTSTTNGLYELQQSNNEDDSSTDSRVSCSSVAVNKRLRFVTPPPELENNGDLLPPPVLLHEVNHENFFTIQRNRHLLETIQSKMLELQQELDEFEQDFGVNEEDLYAVDNAQQANISEQEAEALGYAMCAQETMHFLQREGIPADSLLYTRLHDALVGQEGQGPALRF